MRRIQILFREVDDEQRDATRDLATFDLPATDVASLQSKTAGHRNRVDGPFGQLIPAPERTEVAPAGIELAS
jgi:hypothetical protein